MPLIARAWSLTSLSTAFQSPDSSHPTETRDVDSSVPRVAGRSSLSGGERDRARPLRFERIAAAAAAAAAAAKREGTLSPRVGPFIISYTLQHKTRVLNIND